MRTLALLLVTLTGCLGLDAGKLPEPPAVQPARPAPPVTVEQVNSSNAHQIVNKLESELVRDGNK